MKTLYLLLVTFLLSGLAAAQDTSIKSGPPDISVMKISWRRVDPPNLLIEGRHASTNPEDGAKRAVNSSRIYESRSSRESGGCGPPPRLLAVSSGPDPTPTLFAWSGYVYEFVVQNTGTKVIRHVVFEHSYTDPATQRTVGRREYKSNVRIRPGLTGKIVVHSSRPPMGVVNASQAGQKPQELPTDQMVIQKIKYADGSVWERETK